MEIAKGLNIAIRLDLVLSALCRELKLNKDRIFYFICYMVYLILAVINIREIVLKEGIK